jgi:hypothetical protein
MKRKTTKMTMVLHMMKYQILLQRGAVVTLLRRLAA